MPRCAAPLALLLALPAALRAQGADPLPARVDSVVMRVLAATGVPSASVAVVRHDSLVHARAYGDARLEPRTAATTSMRYGIGSISKQFTAAAILLLQQDGKLRLDDPVEQWVPGLTRGGEVTLRQLLSHTSGYQDFWPQDYVPLDMMRPTTPMAILARWARKPLDFEPGSRWQYSNTNYTIAGLVVEKASGMPFWQFLQSRILAPLGMTSAVDWDAGGPASVETRGYLRYALGPLRPALPEGAGWMFGAGAIAMTPSDLAKWDRAMIEGRLLSPASWTELERTVLLSTGVSSAYGLGVDVGTTAGHRSIGHSGEVSGYTAQNIVFPDDSAAVVVLTNQDAASASGAIAQGVAALLFTTQDAMTGERTERAKRIFAGLQHGTIDRSLFTADANAYFTEGALKDFAASLAPLGTPTSFTQTRQALRGGMTLRSWSVAFPGRTLRVWTFEMPDGTIEQYQVAPTS